MHSFSIFHRKWKNEKCHIAHDTMSLKIYSNSSQSHLGRACCHSSWQKMHSSTACASCAMSTAYKSSYSDISLQSHHSLVPNSNIYANLNPTYCTNPTTSTGYSTGLNLAVGHGMVRVRFSTKIVVRV